MQEKEQELLRMQGDGEELLREVLGWREGTQRRGRVGVAEDGALWRSLVAALGEVARQLGKSDVSGSGVVRLEEDVVTQLAEVVGWAEVRVKRKIHFGIGKEEEMEEVDGDVFAGGEMEVEKRKKKKRRMERSGDWMDSVLSTAKFVLGAMLVMRARGKEKGQAQEENEEDGALRMQEKIIVEEGVWRAEELFRDCASNDPRLASASFIYLAVILFKEDSNKSLDYLENALLLLKEDEKNGNFRPLFQELSFVALHNLACIFRYLLVPAEESEILKILLKKAQNWVLPNRGVGVPHLSTSEASLFISLSNQDLGGKASENLLRALSLSGKSQEALTRYQHEKNVRTPSYLREVAFAMLESNQALQAEEICRQLLQVDSNDIAALIYLADSLVCQSKPEDALPFLDQAKLALDSKSYSKSTNLALNALICNNKALVLLLMGNTQIYFPEVTKLLEQSLGYISGSKGNLQAAYNLTLLKLQEAGDDDGFVSSAICKRWLLESRGLFQGTNGEESLSNEELINSLLQRTEKQLQQLAPLEKTQRNVTPNSGLVLIEDDNNNNNNEMNKGLRQVMSVTNSNQQYGGLQTRAVLELDAHILTLWRARKKR